MSISEETFFLEKRFEGTLQSQIQQMVAEGILSGRFQPGEKMPSSRKLAAHLGVSRLTVTLAYNELIADDYLTSSGRSGYFVSHSAPPPPSFPAGRSRDTVDWPRAIGRRYTGARLVEKYVDWQSFRYPFVYGQADPDLFDQQNWRLCAVQALGRKDFTSLTADYGDQDDPKLVEFIARHTLPRRGILARPEEILITAGAQNALWLAAQILLTQRRTAAHETPCYPGLRDILHQTRCHLLPIPVDEHGLSPDALPASTDVLFTTPSHQCPTTATMPLDRRHALLKRARDDDFLVVEDDYEFEMSFLTTPSPALKSLDEDGRVIYVGSFSKSLFPGLRLGYLVGSRPFIEEARALRATVFRHLPGHIQRTAAYFLSRGHYDALIRRLRNALHERRKVMDNALNDHGLEIAGAASFGGSSYWMSTTNDTRSDDLARRLKERGVLIEPGTPFFDRPEDGQSHFRLAYSSIPVERIPDGIAILADEM
ncbi:PLP-dependent aminotransferase family protein [Aliiroseovarius sp. YM-037]|uniref:MocR-like pyridoxine biosynthesis transcription factor PdxR n=1 Tax=Aliiroseovarius sp. YM-037 TaxID=3341728 RepID=UPI003A7FB4AD